MNTLQKFSIISSLVIGSATLASQPVAATTFSISGITDLGFDLAGSVTFDDALVTNDAFFQASDFSFSIDGSSVAVDLADVFVEFVGLEFVGVAYFDTTATNDFVLIPGFGDGNLDQETVVGGYFDSDTFDTGDVTYTSAPEPMTLLGSLVAVGIGAIFRKRQRHTRT